jgi:ABC-2 type transport system ATP-binding protein
MIHARKLSRTFKTRTGPVEAVRGVDLDVEAGEVVGFLGPNGAGKTTTLR